MTTPTNVVLALASTGRHVAMNLGEGSIGPTLPRTQQPADERSWRSRGNGVVFFKPQGRSRWAERTRQWSVALLVIAALAGLVLLVLVVAFAGGTPYNS